MHQPSFCKGVFFAVSAYLLWGILPLYWKTLSAISSLHILGFRIILSLLFVGSVLFFHKNTSWLKFYRNREKRLYLVLAGIMISINWGLYIWAVNSGHTIETSLGYYINPLLSIILGLCFFREKLKVLQVIAFGLAFVGVLLLTVLTGRPPWISLGLAFSFALYGLLKKTINLSAMESLGVETLVSLPLGLLLLFSSFGTTIIFPDPHAISYVFKFPTITLLMLLLVGFVSSFPLYLFAKGAKILPLSTLGFIQFLSPTMSFLTGLLIFKESFPLRNFIAFGFIWTAAILYIISISRGQNSKNR